MNILTAYASFPSILMLPSLPLVHDLIVCTAVVLSLHGFFFLSCQACYLIAGFYRVSSSEFIIPVKKFLRSLDYSYSIGTRFRMRFETEDAAERRFDHTYVFSIFDDLINRESYSILYWADLQD